MGVLHKLTRKRHIQSDVPRMFASHFGSGRILDLPAGTGVNARSLAAAGFDVVAGDLFPEHCRGEGYAVRKVDLTKPLPFDDASFDGILFSEGIEHLDAQVAVLREMARILKPGGVLIVTTPNLLNLEARVCMMLTGHARRNRALVVSTAQYRQGTKPEKSSVDEEVYFGHVFLINAFQLRFYLEHVGLEVVGVDTVRYSRNALLAAPFLYPLVWLATVRELGRKTSRLSKDQQRSYREQVLSGAVLFGRKLIMIARKPGG
ncbi:MAG: class I SAM-dependent methyltransferase [Desulfohalobiaceae bacterium]